MKTRRLALRVSLNSAVMIFAVYFVMQLLTYLRDDVLWGVKEFSSLPATVTNFLGGSVLPPLVIFGLVLYFSALPLQRVLERLRSGAVLDEKTAEKTRRRMLRFSRLVLVLNILGFTLGFFLLLILQGRMNELLQPDRLLVLASNLAGAVVYASAQSALNDLAFAELRERLGIHEIGTRKRQLSSSARQIVLASFLVVYALTFVQLNINDVVVFQSLERQVLREASVAGTGPAGAAELFRSRVAATIASSSSRIGFDPASLPLPWERQASPMDVQRWIFLIFFVYMAAIAVTVQAISSAALRNQLEGIRDRVRDVVDGEGDLRLRLNLRNMDELGELSELINRLLDRFGSLVGRIGVAAAQTKEVAVAIDRSLAAAEIRSGATEDAVRDFAGALEEESRRSEDLRAVVEAFRSSVVEVSAAVDAQGRSASETAAAMEEMSSSIRSVESMTENSGALSEELVERGRSGGGAARDTGAAITEIESSARKVLDMLGALNKIAGDTNLLAMNAAIEAAHAGDRGAGFAVVADEVRALANNSALQTKTIKGLVQEMLSKVETGVRQAEASGLAIGGLVSGVEKAAEISREIAEAMREQASGAQLVEASVASVAEESQSIREKAAHQASATEDMARRLERTLEELRDLAAESRRQADSVAGLVASFAEVRAEADRNRAAVETLNGELSRFRL